MALYFSEIFSKNKHLLLNSSLLFYLMYFNRSRSSFLEGKKGKTKEDLLLASKKIKNLSNPKDRANLILPFLQSSSFPSKELVKYFPLQDLKKAGMSPKKMLSSLIALEEENIVFSHAKGELQISESALKKIYKKISSLYSKEELFAYGFSNSQIEEILSEKPNQTLKKKEPTIKIKQFEVKHYL